MTAPPFKYILVTPLAMVCSSQQNPLPNPVVLFSTALRHFKLPYMVKKPMPEKKELQKCAQKEAK